MRVAYLCADPGIPVFGTKGASVHVQEMVRAFQALGMGVSVYCTRAGGHLPADLAGLRVVERPVLAGTPAGRERAVARSAADLAAAAIADGCDLVYERYSLFSTAGATVARITGAPLVLEVNAPLIDEQREHRVLVDEPGATLATRTMVDAAALAVCVSEPVAAWLHTVTDAPPGRIAVVTNGVNTHRFQPALTRTASSRFTVGFIGTLKPWHGVDTLIRATTRAAAVAAARAGRGPSQPAPAWRLVIAGDGPEGATLRRLAETSLAETPGADAALEIEFTGAIPPEEVPPLLAGFDVAVAPYPAATTERAYFSPLKLFEYLAAGLPVVASAVGQIPQVIDDGFAGLLVPPGDERALADALSRLSLDRSLRHRLGLAARALAIERHDWHAVLERILGRIPTLPAAVLPDAGDTLITAAPNSGGHR